MPNIRSAKKRQRQSVANRTRNRVQRSELRTAVKRVRELSGAKARDAHEAAEKLIDRAARKGLIGRNTAARTKSRLVKHIAAN